jgi:hypothetical protein
VYRNGKSDTVADKISPCLISFSYTFLHGLGILLGMTKEFEGDIAI